VVGSRTRHDQQSAGKGRRGGRGDLGDLGDRAPARRRVTRLALALATWLAIAVAGCGGESPPAEGCGNGTREGVERCDDGNLADGDGCDADCTITACGNGIVTAGEACDDGNAKNGDGCDVNCAVPACGNGARAPGERCDDGNLTDGDGCDHDCTITRCGNGIATASEVCDDGNLTNGDGCDVNCTISACGNGAAAPDERCDDGNLTDGDGCDHDCTVTRCGNAIATAGEACDDGNLTNGDGCDVNCTISVCGNGALAPGEACDDGNLANGDGCDSNCTVTRCGNAIVTAGEVCDDGNLTNGDGCDVNCKVSACGNGALAPGEVCDDGNLTNGDGCDANCKISACGNGARAPSEACDDGNLTDGDGCDSNCTPTACGNAIPTPGEVCDDGNSTNGDGCDNDCTASLRTYVKASNTGAGDRFGWNLALSADGSTLAVGTFNEDSAATGVNGSQADDSFDTGAVYVFTRSGATWVQQAYLKASNTGASDRFGRGVALSANGSILAVGATSEASAATGINGNQADNSATNAGAVYVFTRSGTTWTQQAYLKASNTGAGDAFGRNVALSDDGSILAVTAELEDSAATGIDGNQADNSAPDAGAVYVFARSGTTWTQQAYLKASNTGADDQFGESVALAGNGSTLAVGASGEDSAATGIGGSQFDNNSTSSGAVYVFTRVGTTWSQQAYVKASNTGASDLFGTSLALSQNGSTLAVGATGEDSAATGIGGNQFDNSASSAGAVYVLTRTGTTWSQQAYVKASNTETSDGFGGSVALSADGSALAVSAPREDSAATGVGGNQTSNLATDAGAVYTFARSGATWSQRAYVKASNTGAGDWFGHMIALSANGLTLAVSAALESGAATDVDGDQADDSASIAGAAYVFH
jgi:trimeric autotransporter adhesin